jgi:hypothetical protein
MKILQTTTTELNTREFNKLSDEIIASIYDLAPDIENLYDIHINYIQNSWRIDFVPLVATIPIIKVDTITETNDSGSEILKILPSSLSDVPKTISLKQESRASDSCMNYITIFECILALYDFEFALN